MARYIATRICSSLIILWIISILVFLLMTLLPGDPTLTGAGLEATPEQRELFRDKLGLNDPLPQRYGDWLFHALQGDLGVSTGQGAQSVSISSVFARRIPATMELGILSLLVVVTVAVPIGVLAALKPGSKREVAASTAMIVGNSIPEFLTGIALILVIALRFDLLPVGGYVAFLDDPIENLKRMAMPVLAISLTATTLLMRQTRSAMINVLSDDYIRTARAKGLRERTVVVRHGLRNALIPVITIFGFQAGLIFSGAVITEHRLQHPGHGPPVRRERRRGAGLQRDPEHRHVLRDRHPAPESPGRPLLHADRSAHPGGTGGRMSGDRTPAGSAAPPALARAGLRERHWYREARGIGRVYARNRPAVVGAVLLLGFGLVAGLAPLVAPADPFLTGQTRESVFNAPSWDHLAGTDALGRDVLSRTIFGARIAWQVVLVATGVAVGIGVPLGLLAGYVGGKLDELVIMRFVDAVMALPGLVLILALTGAVGPSLTNTMIIIGIVWSPGYARLTRGVVLQIRQEVFVDAARAIGATPARIMRRHLLPNVIAPIMVLASLSAAGIILVEAGLSFIGAGVQEPTPAWGRMAADANKTILTRSAWPLAGPAIAIVLMVMSFNFVGDGMRDAIDPRLRNIR